jgi:hypothetical protein
MLSRASNWSLPDAIIRGRRQPLPSNNQPQRTMEFFDTEDFSIFDLVDECQPYEELSPEARQMLNQVEYYDDYSQGSQIDHDYD